MSITTVRKPVTDSVVTHPVLLELRRQLQASPFAAIKSICCDLHEGVAILRGRVPTFYTRQLVLALVMKVPGVEEVDDRIVVDGIAARNR